MVAFFAHLGGFVAGLLLIRPAMTGRRKVEADRWHGWRPPPRRPPPGVGGRRNGRLSRCAAAARALGSVELSLLKYRCHPIPPWRYLDSTTR